jgi:hypothetical protein
MEGLPASGARRGGRNRRRRHRRLSLEAAGLRDGTGAPVVNPWWKAALRPRLVVTELMALPASSGMVLTRRSAVGAHRPVAALGLAGGARAGWGMRGLGPRLYRAGGQPWLGTHAKAGGGSLPWCPRLRSGSGWPGPDGPWRASGYAGARAGADMRVE